MKVKKILIILLVIVITAFFLTNFSSIYTIDDYAYVIAMGLDNSDDSDDAHPGIDMEKYERDAAIIEELREIDVNSMTPIEAMNTLAELISKSKE